MARSARTTYKVESQQHASTAQTAHQIPGAQYTLLFDDVKSTLTGLWAAITMPSVNAPRLNDSKSMASGSKNRSGTLQALQPAYSGCNDISRSIQDPAAHTPSAKLPPEVCMTGTRNLTQENTAAVGTTTSKQVQESCIISEGGWSQNCSLLNITPAAGGLGN